MYIELLDSTLEFSDVFIEYAQMPLKVIADISSWTRGLNFGLSLYIHPYCVYKYASAECSGESVYLHGLARAFVARHCNKYRHLKVWPICFCKYFVLAP